MQDLIRVGNWTMNLGLRWDHYQLVVNSNAVQPRVAISRYFPELGLMAHFSYDRVFQTPSFENILLASSFEAQFINPDFLVIPVKPSVGQLLRGGSFQVVRQQPAARRQLLLAQREQLR